MKILWAALRAVSVETMGILAVLWMLGGASGLALDLPWRSTSEEPTASLSSELDGQPFSRNETLLVANNPVDYDSREPFATAAAEDESTQRASVRQWFNTLFPVNTEWTDESPASESHVEYTRERLDHYSRLYGIASRD